MPDDAAPRIEFHNSGSKNRSTYDVSIDGERMSLDRVTSLLGGFPKPALAYAQANEAALAAIAMGDRLLDEAQIDKEALKKKLAASAFSVWKVRADTGTAVHQKIEDHIIGSGRTRLIPEGVDGAEVQQMFEQYLAFEQHHKPEYEASEITCISTTHGYAGTADIIAKVDGKRYILDVKTTKPASDGGPGVYMEQACQMAAYMNADYLFDSDAGIAQRVPEIHGAAIIWIGREKWELVPMNVTQEVFDAFLHAAAVHKAIKRNDKNPAGGPWWRSAEIIKGA